MAVLAPPVLRVPVLRAVVLGASEPGRPLLYARLLVRRRRLVNGTLAVLTAILLVLGALRG